MRIAVVGHLKFPIARPFAGGLEAFTHQYVRSLQARGHEVTLFASADSDGNLPLEPVIDQATMPATEHLSGQDRWEVVERCEDRAYTRLVRGLTHGAFDIVHNNSLSPVPLLWATRLNAPLFTTLHVPPLPRLKAAVERAGRDRCGHFVSISMANMRSWVDLIGTQQVIHNGVDADFWSPQPEATSPAPRAIWFGRILPDKGTHYAVAAAHAAGLPIDVVGPVSDERYFRKYVRPQLGPGDCYHGHQDHVSVRSLLRRAAVCLVTPCWDEPFGLVAAESLACGTPVAAFARGALPEIVSHDVGTLAPPDCVDSLANATLRCLRLDRSACRAAAERSFGFEAMMDRYEALFEAATLKVAA